MASFRDRREPLHNEEMADSALRKNAFREMAKDLVDDIRNRRVTDAPGEVARLMEKAFKAGLAAREMNPDTKPSSRTTNRRMTDRDLAPTAVKAIQMMRLFSVGYKYYDGPPGEPPYKHPPHAVLFLVPQMQGIYAALTKDDWRLASRHGEHQDYSNKAIGPLIKAGLLEENWLQSGMQIATFTEWGYELLVTGETSLPENRVRHQSATARE